MYSALNVGFPLGSLIGGFALALHSNDVLHALPWFTAVVFLVNAAAISRLPRASHDDRSPEDRKVKVAGPGPLRNLGWLLTTFCGGVFWTNQVLLNIVIPLWLVEETDAPAGAVGLPVRNQHGDVHLPPDGGGPRSRGRADGPEGGPGV